MYADYFFYYVYECISNNVMLHNFFFLQRRLALCQFGASIINVSPPVVDVMDGLTPPVHSGIT